MLIAQAEEDPCGQREYPQPDRRDDPPEDPLGYPGDADGHRVAGVQRAQAGAGPDRREPLGPCLGAGTGRPHPDHQELSREEARQFIKSYFDKYSGVKEYLSLTKREAAEKGYVQTLLGKRRYIPEIKSSNAQERMGAERMAINMPVQGTSADIIKVAMIQLQREMDNKGLDSKMILQVHDELLFEAPSDELPELKQLIIDIMPHAIELSVPLKVDIKMGKNWDEMEYEV